MNFYEKFKQETPQLSFQNSCIIEAEFFFDTYERWDAGEEEKVRHHEAITYAIEKLKEDQKIAPELSYLVNFLEKYMEAEKAEKDEFKIQIDLEKLKYCKTLIAYIEDDYSEEVLALLDYLQDDLIETMDLDEDMVFFLPTTQNFCVMRKDLYEEGSQVPVGLSYYYSLAPIQCKWMNDDENFMVLVNGFWQEAYSNDFDYPFEHLKVD